MQPIPNDVLAPDVWQWLNNGWFFHCAGDDVYVPARMENHGGDFEVHRTDGQHYDYVRDECFPHWPECGAVNCEGFAVIVERQQVRQYRRTYNSRCVLLNIPRKWDAMKLYPWVKDASPDNPEIVNAVFKPSYHTYTQALDLLDSGWVSVALNHHLIVAGNRADHLLYYRGKMLANVRQGVVEPLDPNNPRNLRILKWLDGRVRYEDPSGDRQRLRDSG